MGLLNNLNSYQMSRTNILTRLKPVPVELRAVPRQEVIDELKRVGLYKRVMHNIKFVGWKGFDEVYVARQAEEANKCKDMCDFLNESFFWRNSKEKEAFWSEVWGKSWHKTIDRNFVITLVKELNQSAKNEKEK